MTVKQINLKDLPAFQRSLVIGYLLSDGYLRSNGSMQFENCVGQESFIDWLWHHMEGYRTQPRPRLVHRIDNRTGKSTFAVRFYSRSCFKELHSLFYPHGKKIIPKEIGPYFDVCALAIFYMGDGQLDADGKCYIAACHSWTNEDIAVLQNILLINFGFQTQLHTNGINKQGNRILRFVNFKFFRI